MIWYNLLFSLKGRLNRQGFWIGVGFNFIILFLIANFPQNLTASQPLFFLPLFICGYSLLTIGVKRLHDRGRSGKNALILSVPFICLITARYLPQQSTEYWLIGLLMPMLIFTLITIEWGFFKGESQANLYGEKGLSLSLK